MLSTTLVARLSEISPRALSAAFTASGRRFIAEPDSAEVIDAIEAALRERRPFSAVRLGDGEASVLLYGDAATTTPVLDRFAAETSVTQNVDRFEPTHETLVELRDALLGSIERADVVGILGLWPPLVREGEDISIDAATAFLRSDPRGLSGQVRGRFLALTLNAALPLDIVFAPAHFYAAVLRGLDRLLEASTRVVCVTSNEAAVEIVRERALDVPVDFVPVGTGEGREVTPRDGLRDVAARLPGGPGVLYLIGAGLWAELYCDVVKQRGGVGVDLGSGFDFLAGSHTRPIHGQIATLLDPSNRAC